MSFWHKRLGRTIWFFIKPFSFIILGRSNRSYVLITDKRDKQILVVKNWLSDQRWRLPGGGLRWNEDFEQAAVREMSEELGIKINSNKLENILTADDEIGYRYQVFVYKIDQKPELKLNRWEVVAHSWLVIDKLQTHNIHPILAKAVGKLHEQQHKNYN